MSGAVAMSVWKPLDRDGRVIASALVAAAALAPLVLGPYGLAVATEIAIFVLFAASLHLLVSVGGVASFGHAAFLGLGCYGAALAVKMLGIADAAGARRRPSACGARRRRDRLVRGAPLGRLRRDADARLRADFVVDRLSVGAGDRRRQWPARRLAITLGGERRAFLLVDARPCRSGGRRPSHDHLLALRLCAAGRARFRPAQRGHRHRPETHAMAGLRRSPARARASRARCSRSSRAASFRTRWASQPRSTGW